MTAQIRSVIDKLYSFCVAEKEIAGKECALITCCEDEDATAMNGVQFAYERSAKYLHWKPVGEVMISSVNAVGDIHITDGCQKAAALAELFSLLSHRSVDSNGVVKALSIGNTTIKVTYSDGTTEYIRVRQ